MKTCRIVQGFGADEELWQMLQVSDFLGMPGHFTNKCLQQGKNTDFITRLTCFWLIFNIILEDEEIEVK